MDLYFLLQFGLLFLLLLISVHFLINTFVFQSPSLMDEKVNEHEYPLISILIPARNEENNLRSCLNSMVQQSYPKLEIFILDDQSTDKTPDIIKEFTKDDSRIAYLPGKKLPKNWTGKAWACHQLAEKAKGEYIVFTDADTIHNPHCILSAYHQAIDDKADLLSLWPRQLCKTWSEILVVPFIYVLLLTFLPHWMGGRFKSLGAANGQFLFFRRKAYRNIKGHDSVRNHLVDDVALARLIKIRGYNLKNKDGSDFITCRMYTNFKDLWSGFSKNLRAGHDSSLVSFLTLSFLQFFLYLMPFLLVLAHLLGIEPIAKYKSLFGICICQCGVIIAMRCAMSVVYRHHILSAFLHPLGQILTLVIALNSWRLYAFGRVFWKERKY
ncbi:MAG: glycosyltransferase family 2 protein [Verrucomicrobiota bacterium]